MMEATNFPDLFDEAQALFKDMVDEFAAYGIKINPDLKLRRIVATLSYYDFSDGNIYLGLPDPNHPMGRLMWIMGKSLLFCQNDEETVRFMRFFMRRLLAHELGHHVRHYYGLLIDDKWHEEQVANQLAAAYLMRHFSHEDRLEAIRIIKRALDSASGPKAQIAAAATYYNVVDALNVDGKISNSMVTKFEAVSEAFAISPEEMLKGGAFPSQDMVQHLAQRGEAIEEINTEYVSDQMRYMNYHLGWLYYDLTSRQTFTMDEFARTHLGIKEDLLASPNFLDNLGHEAIRACYQAFKDCEATSPTAARYFYKRYRSLLIAALQAAGVGAQEEGGPIVDWIESLLESWSNDKMDALDLLTQITPPELQGLLPHRIGQRDDPPPVPETSLPDSTDVRIWQHSVHAQPDQAAENTLGRLKLLDQSSVFGYLPAEVMLRIAGDLSHIYLHQGDTMVWQGDTNNDIYLAVEGDFAVVVTVGGKQRQIGLLHAGDIIGEMAFFTGAARSASIIAKTPARCFLLKSSSLRALAYQHPILLMQMARSLAERLEFSSASQKTIM